MDESTLQRGDQRVTYYKDPAQFAVRLRAERARDEAELEQHLGKPRVEVRHVESLLAQDYELFAVQEADEREGTMDDLRLALYPPNRISVALPAPTGTGGLDLAQGADSANDPGLFGRLLGSLALGEWRPRIEDQSQAGNGVLARWSPQITYRTSLEDQT
jgi:hypothetical protein